jgi:hypothetical protein
MSPQSEPTVPAPDTGSLAMRVLHMLLFAAVFWVLCWTVAITAIVQLGFRVFATAPSPEIARFGAGLGRYASQVIAYLSFARDALPFPFGDWPEVPTGVTQDDLRGL